MNNGTLGAFTFDEEKMYGGTISNTKLDSDNYIYVGSTRHNLSDYSRCFTDITANSAAGTFTLTRTKLQSGFLPIITRLVALQ